MIAPATFWAVADSVIWRSPQGAVALDDDGRSLLEIILDEHQEAWRDEADVLRSKRLAALADQIIAAQSAAQKWRRASTAQREMGS